MIQHGRPDFIRLLASDLVQNVVTHELKHPYVCHDGHPPIDQTLIRDNLSKYGLDSAKECIKSNLFENCLPTGEHTDLRQHVRALAVNANKHLQYMTAQQQHQHFYLANVARHLSELNSEFSYIEGELRTIGHILSGDQKEPCHVISSTEHSFICSGVFGKLGKVVLKVCSPLSFSDSVGVKEGSARALDTTLHKKMKIDSVLSDRFPLWADIPASAREGQFHLNTAIHTLAPFKYRKHTLYISITAHFPLDLFEWIAKTDVKERIKHLPLLAKQLVQAVEFMHARGIAHMALKPENILIDPQTGEEFVALCGFGSAEYLDQSQRNLGNVHVAIDYFALGVTLLEMVDIDPNWLSRRDQKRSHIEPVNASALLEKIAKHHPSLDTFIKAVRTLIFTEAATRSLFKIREYCGLKGTVTKSRIAELAKPKTHIKF